MIPKIIHYCWLSNDPIPAELQKYMKSWKKYLPDYEFRLWNFERFDIESSIWVKEAFGAKKYAFAADYIRCYALYHHGGIYLDMDVEVLKSFDDLLERPYFFGQEYGGEIEAAIMGAEKESPFFKKMTEYYEGRHFIQEDGNFDMLTLPLVIQRVLQQSFSWEYIPSLEEAVYAPDKILILPQEYFSPKSYIGKITKTANTYTIHHFAGSWVNSWRKKAKKRFFKIIGPRGAALCVSVKAFFVRKNK